MQRRPPEISDYWEIFLRRRWWVIVPTLLVASAVAVVSVNLPRYYRSETMILVDAQKVPTDYVKNSVGGDVNERLQTISQEILSRTRLQRVIDQFSLYKEKTKMSQEDIVELMRKDITLEVVADKREGVQSKALGGFRIGYTGQNPVLVQQVTRQIGSLFIEENLKLRQAQAEGTNQFIEQELDKARVELQEQELKIKGFKSKYMGSLPEQEQANLQMIGQTQQMLQANSDAIGRAQQQKTYLESLSEVSAKKNSPPVKTEQQAHLNAKRAELLVAEQKYQPNHPDLVRLREEVKALEAQAKTLAGTESSDKNDGQPDNLKGQLAALNLEIKSRTQRQTELEARIRGLQGKVDLLPAIELQFAELNRDYLISKDHYQSLLQKKNASSMAADVEHQAQGEQFRVIDPASLPQRPYKPDLIQMNAFGLVLGLALGVGLAAFQEFNDRSMHNDKDIAFYLPIVLLGTMPVVMNSESLRLRTQARRRTWILSSGTAIILIAVGAYLFLHRSAFIISG
jgi:succinoglycan biosynthesis transport protein ExoP